MRTRYYKKIVLLGAVFAFLYSYKAVNPYDYQIPFGDVRMQEQCAAWEKIFAENMELQKENVPNFDNVIIWVFDETDQTGHYMKWQILYALPPGYGISCCEKEYVSEHLDALQSRYLLTQSGAEVAGQLQRSGYREIAADGDVALYRLR